MYDPRVATYRLKRPIADAEAAGGRIQDFLVHPTFWILVAGVVGLIVGMQMAGVSQRIVKLGIAAAYILVLARLPLYVGVGIFLILYAFPTAIWIGNTNFIFTVAMLVVWFIKVAMRLEDPPRRTYLDWAIVAYIAAHILSFANVNTSYALKMSLLAFRHMMTPIAFYYVLVNVGRSEKRLLYFAEMLSASMLLIYITAFMERYMPGVTIIPRWYLMVIQAESLFTGEAGHRIGGVMRTHSLLSDSSAFFCILQAYLAIRYRHKPWARYYHWFLAAAAVYVISLTENRGGLILLIMGALYFLWIFRREVTIKRVLVGLFFVLLILTLGEKTLGRFEGNVTLLARMAGTHIERGIPDTRQTTWRYIWGLIMQNPIFGHGPFFDYMALLRRGHPCWPHSGYLYYMYTIGLIGLPTFLVLAWRVLKRTWVGRNLSVGGAPLSHGLTAVFHIGAVQYLTGQLRTDHQRADVFVFFMWIVFAIGILARDVWEEEKRKAMATSSSRGSHEKGRNQSPALPIAPVGGRPLRSASVPPGSQSRE